MYHLPPVNKGKSKLDTNTLLQEFTDALQGNNLEAIVRLGNFLLSSGIDLEEKQYESLRQAHYALIVYKRLIEEIQNNNDILIVEVWRMNYEILKPHITRDIYKRVDLALQRIHNFAKLRTAFRLCDYRIIVQYYDPVLYESSTLFGERERRIYLEGRNRIRMIHEIESAIRMKDDRILYLIYPEDRLEIDELLNDDQRKEIWTCREKYAHLL